MILKKISVLQILTHFERFALLVLALFGLRIALALFGVMDPVYAGLPDLSAPALIGPLLLHAAYGFLLFFWIIAAGLGVLSFLSRSLSLKDSDFLVFAFPAGLVIVTLAALIHTAGVFNSVWSLAVTFPFALPGMLRLWRLSQRCGLFSATTALTLFLAICYGAYLGIAWRTPSAEWIGSVFMGDLSIYTGSYHALRYGQFPIPNLGAEGEMVPSYFNQLTTLLALLVDDLPTFDIGLFFTTSLTLFLLPSLFLALRGLMIARDDEAPLPPSLLVLAISLLVAAGSRPSWTVESPPVVILFGLITPLVYAVHRAGSAPLPLLLTFFFAAFASIGSKVVSLSVLGGYAGLSLVLACWRQVTRRQMILIGLAMLPVAGYAATMIAHFAPDFLAYFDLGPPSWHRLDKGFFRALPDIARDGGFIVLAIGAYLMSGLALGATVAVGATLFLIHFQVFGANHPTAFAVVAMVLILRPQADRRATRWLAAAAILTLPYGFFRDAGESEAALTWLAAAVPTFWFALTPGLVQEADRSSAQFDRVVKRLACGVLVFAVVALPALALGKLRINDDEDDWADIGKPSLAKLWDATRERTPPTALIFTDQTGDDEERFSGWNDYALRAERQFYLASWSTSRLRIDATARRQRLSLNAAVLSGRCPPQALDLSRGYEGYYAAVNAGLSVPDHFVEVYANRDYRLLQIADAPNDPKPGDCLPGGAD